MPSRCWLLVAALSATFASTPVAAQPCPEPGASRPAGRTDELLARAVQLYQDSEFDESKRLLEQVLRAVAGQRSHAAREAYTYLAYVQVAFGDNDAAVKAFEQALDIQPGLRLGSTAPRITAALEQARRRRQARVRALDHDPPQQLHVPAHEAPAGKPVTIVDEVSDPSGVQRVLLNYRVSGHRGFTQVHMERDARGRFLASIPAPIVVGPRLEYFLEAWDNLGNGPGLKGSPSRPISVPVVGGLTVAPPPSSPPRWYKRWWVWTIAAGVVVAAGAGGAAGAYLSRSQQGRVTVIVNPSDLNR